jgi:hypothetical protein
MHEIMLCSTKYLQFIYHKVLSMAPPKDHAVGDLLIVAKFEFIWFICCILMEKS